MFCFLRKKFRQIMFWIFEPHTIMHIHSTITKEFGMYIVLTNEVYYFYSYYDWFTMQKLEIVKLIGKEVNWIFPSKSLLLEAFSQIEPLKAQKELQIPNPSAKMITKETGTHFRKASYPLQYIIYWLTYYYVVGIYFLCPF